MQAVNVDARSEQARLSPICKGDRVRNPRRNSSQRSTPMARPPSAGTTAISSPKALRMSVSHGGC